MSIQAIIGLCEPVGASVGGALGRVYHGDASSPRASDGYRPKGNGVVTVHAPLPGNIGLPGDIGTAGPELMEATRLIMSGLLSLAGLSYGIVYLVCGDGRSVDAVWTHWDTPDGCRRRRKRRRMGAAIIVLTSAAFFPGVNYLSPRPSPGGYLLYWLAILALMVWLCGLGLADVLATRRVRLRMLHSMQRKMSDTDNRADDRTLPPNVGGPSAGESSA